MSWSDPIVEEVRRVREAYAARFNYDLKAIFRDLKEQEKRSGRKFVSYATEPTVAGPGPAPQSNGPAATTADCIPAEPAKS